MSKEKSKLEKEYDQINNPNKTLEEIEKVSISDYKMIEGDYKILITVYEANELEPRPAEMLFFDLNKTAIDGFVEIEIRGQTRRTAVRKQTNNPIWQESFYFQFSNLSVQDLDNSKIVFNVYDKNTFIIKNSHIGRIELDWTNIYFRRFHEIYRGWLTLSDPNEENVGTVGFLLVSIAVLGPEDKVMVHDTAFIKDPLTTIEDTITNSKVRLIDYTIVAEIYRAESLVPLDLFSRNVDAYVVAKFSGNKVKTNTVTSLNPEWNKALKIGTGVPNKSKYLILEVWNHNYFPKKHDLIGTIKIPFIDICENKYNSPRWCNMYGPPMCAVDQPPNNYASKMELYGEQLGSHYRGRLLFKVVGKKYVKSSSGMSEIIFKFPYKPTPVVPLKTYTLSVELIEGFQLPQRPEAQILVAIGQYLIRPQKKFVVEKKMCEFHYILEDKKVQFPEDSSQVPDIIIYFCDGPEEKNRMCYTRIKAKQIQTSIRHKNSDIYELTGDKSLGRLQMFEIGGYLNCRVNLYTREVPMNKIIEKDLLDKTPFDLYMYIFKGEDFPPAKVEGDCWPQLQFDCFGSCAKSSYIKGTFNPFWAQTVKIQQINMQQIINQTTFTKGLIVEAHDYISQNKSQFIGSFLIKLNSKNKVTYKPSAEDRKESLKHYNQAPAQTSFIYVKPKWYYILNPHIEIGKHVFGRVLMSVALFKREDIQQNRIPKFVYDFDERKRIDQKKEKFKPMVELETRRMQIYVVGLRQITDSSKRMLQDKSAELKITLHGEQLIQKDVNMKMQLKKSGCDFNKLIIFDVSIPKNKTLVPFLDFKVLYDDQFYGFNSVSLYKLLPKLKEKEGENTYQDDSEDTILDVEGLENQLNLLRDKKRREQNEVKKPEQTANILQLGVPPEIGNIMGVLSDQKEVEQLDKLLADTQKNLLVLPEYSYVAKLREHKEGKAGRHSRQDKHVGDQAPSNLNNSIFQQSIKPLDEEENDNQSASLNQRNQPRKFEELSKQNENSQSKFRHANFAIKQTVFQKMRNKNQKQPTTTVKVKDLQNNKVNSQAPFSKNLEQGQPLIADNKPRMLEEIPQEKRIRKENESQHSKNNIIKEGDKEGDEKMSAVSKQIQNILYVNGQEAKKDNYYDSVNRFKVGSDEEKNKQLHFEVRTESVYEDIEVHERAVTYKDVERVMKQEERDQKEALQAERDYRFAQAVKLTLFGWTRKKRQREIETYQDYDSQVGEDLDIIPEWYKGRKILTSDFQDLSFKCSKIQTVPLFGGRLLEKTTIYQRYKQSAGHIKLICLAQGDQIAKQKEQEYTKLLKPRDYFCRIYCLKGKSLISHYEGKPTTFLKFTYGGEQFSLDKQRTVKEENNPEYYICREIPLTLPGPSVIKIEVMQTHDILGKLITKVLGYTQIDIEQRYFTKKWHLYEKKPIELRNLYSEFGIGSQGRLQTWIDLIEKKQWISTPAHKIHPPPFDKYQLRVIVYSTNDCVFKNVEMESNDVFVRGVIGTSEPQETDTHWACRSQGNFNYRFKFPVFYPPKPEDMYSDIFAVQIWDRDLIGFNNLIGQTRINMNNIHKIIQKAVKRRKPVKASMKIKEKNFAITDKFWFDVYNHKEKDQFGIPQPQGRVQLGFELVPWEKAEEELKNGYGRSEPNVYPTLAEPTGRLQFDFFSPLEFIKQILGPNLYRKWCCRIICCLIVLIIALFGYIFFPALIAVKI